jgi:hypothetical protein
MDTSMITHRVHVGCGFGNPWLKWLLGAGVAGIAVAFPVEILTRSEWGALAYIPYVWVLFMMLRHYYVHRPSKMFITWYP